MMRSFALTGSVAAGKSTVGALFREWGAIVLDMDGLVRELQRKGEPTYNAIVAAFGTEVLDHDGDLDRRLLRRRMLASPDDRHRLEAIVHPAVEARRRDLLAAAQARGDLIVIADIPLLFEAGDPSAYDGVIVVDAPVDERRRRLMQSRGFDAHEADQLIAAQMPAEQKRSRARWIIDNDGDRDTLVRRTRDVWKALQP
jgi:dephospho-CoA kinase